ncbi:pinopsin-like [Asterias rubens]|uniref:pinopsin-like n=1 Tax=Asterias rubens TaxID=7604 RepID=UPI0014550C51|nr:pinopsin-like [Asterias rubens]
MEGNFSLLMEPSSEHSIPQLSRTAYTAFAVYLGFVLILSLLGNGLFILTIVRNKDLQNAVNFLLVNICIADMSVALFATPITLMANVQGFWSFGPLVCRWYAFLSSLCGCEQIASIAAIALQRYFFVVKYNLSARTNVYVIACICFTWLYSLAAVIPPAIGWSEFTVEGGGTSCSVNWESGDPSYIIFIFTLVLVIPSSIIIYSYGSILSTVKKTEKVSTLHRCRLRRADKQVTTMAIILVLAFMITWGPYAVYSMYSAVGIGPPISPLLATLPSMFAKLSTAVNPFIYYLLHKKFRTALFKSGRRSKNWLSTRRQALKTSSL